MIKSIIIAVFITLVSTVVCFSADDTIGLVTEVKGKAIVIRDGQQHVPEAGFKLKTNDTLNTGPDSAIGVIFNDETVMSIGANPVFICRQDGPRNCRLHVRPDRQDQPGISALYHPLGLDRHPGHKNGHPSRR